jgi:hypothetical protein
MVGIILWKEEEVDGSEIVIVQSHISRIGGGGGFWVVGII